LLIKTLTENRSGLKIEIAEEEKGFEKPRRGFNAH
jgi:hypothetical protein